MSESNYDLVKTQNLKPAEGLAINCPNGRPALQFIAYKNVEVKTYADSSTNRVRLVVDFGDPFIHPTDKRAKTTRERD